MEPFGFPLGPIAAIQRCKRGSILSGPEAKRRDFCGIANRPAALSGLKK